MLTYRMLLRLLPADQAPLASQRSATTPRAWLRARGRAGIPTAANFEGSPP